MSKYIDFFEQARLIQSVESCISTGDLEYESKVLEVSEPQGNELFHIAKDSEGKLQVLIFAQQNNFRIPFTLMEHIVKVTQTTLASDENM